MEQINKTEKLYNCEKYIKLKLEKNGNCLLNGEDAQSGLPVAGELNAFAVEFAFPEGYGGYNKFVYISFDGKNSLYELKRGENCDESGRFFVVLPNIADKGGVVSFTAVARRDETDEIIKWKPYTVKILDAPVSTDVENAENENTLVDLMNKSKTALDFIDAVKAAEVTVEEAFDGEGRNICVGGVDSIISENSKLRVNFGTVTENHNGDMTPDMLKKLESAAQKEDFPDRSVISGLEFNAQKENLVKLNYKLTNLDDGSQNVTEGIVLPFASQEKGGLMSAVDKTKLDNCVSLDETGHIYSAFLPSFVDDVLEYEELAQFPENGESGKIYVTLDTNKTYRWSGSGYVEISESLALGETSLTAFRGDLGKTAYEHSRTVGNPHATTKSDIGLANVANERQYSPQYMQPYPYGFASASSDFNWCVQKGSPLRVWNDEDGGSVGFRKNCPEYGKMSIVVDGNVYVDEGQKELATLDSPVFTGSPKTPTPPANSDDLTIANTAWVNSKKPKLYLHSLKLASSGANPVYGLLNVYTSSPEPISSVKGVADALGISGYTKVPVSGCCENTDELAICTEARMTSAFITLCYLYVYYNSYSGSGSISKAELQVSSITDIVKEVN